MPFFDTMAGKAETIQEPIPEPEAPPTISNVLMVHAENVPQDAYVQDDQIKVSLVLELKRFYAMVHSIMIYLTGFLRNIFDIVLYRK